MHAALHEVSYALTPVRSVCWVYWFHPNWSEQGCFGFTLPASRSGLNHSSHTDSEQLRFRFGLTGTPTELYQRGSVCPHHQLPNTSVPPGGYLGPFQPLGNYLWTQISRCAAFNLFYMSWSVSTAFPRTKCDILKFLPSNSEIHMKMGAEHTKHLQLNDLFVCFPFPSVQLSAGWPKPRTSWCVNKYIQKAPQNKCVWAALQLTRDNKC